MGVELVREGIRAAGDGGMVGGEKHIPQLHRGITKSEGAKNAREMGCSGGGERKVSRLRGVARKGGDSASLEMTKKAQLKLTRKQRGEMAEAAALGFRVSKPWGESSRYDLIVDSGRRLLRVQVK